MGEQILLPGPALSFQSAPGGEVQVNGKVITREGGWLHVRTLASALARGAPPVVSLRVAVAPADPNGRVGLRVLEITAGQQNFRALNQVQTVWAEFWRASLPEALRAAVDRALNPGARVTREMVALTPERLAALGLDATATTPRKTE